MGNLVGIITSRDAIGKSDDELIEKVMTRNPITVTGKTSVASAGHSMIWEGIDLNAGCNGCGHACWDY